MIRLKSLNLHCLTYQYGYNFKANNMIKKIYAVMLLLVLTLSASAQAKLKKHFKDISPKQITQSFIDELVSSKAGAHATSESKMKAPSVQRSVSVPQYKWVNTSHTTANSDGTSTDISNTYDDKGNLAEQTVRQFDKNGDALSAYKIVHEYDESNKETATRKYKLNESSDWEPVESATYTYNTYGSILSVIVTKYNYGTSGNTYRHKDEEEYDENNNLTAHTEYEYVAGSWTPQMRWEEEYDEENNLCSTADLSGWDANLKTWTTGRKQTVLYKKTRLGLLYLAVWGTYDWDASQKNWMIINQVTKKYEEDNHIYKDLLVQEDSLYRKGNEILGYIISYEYDVVGKLSRSDTWQWKDGSSHLLTYTLYGYDKHGYGLLTSTQTFDSDGYLLSSDSYEWKNFENGTVTYPDLYMVGSFTGWDFQEDWIGEDMGDGIVEWHNVTLNKNDQFKLVAGSDWSAPYNFGLYEYSPVPVNSIVPLQKTGASSNISVQMDAEETTFKTIRLDLKNETLYIESDPTGVDEVNAPQAGVTVKGNRICVADAKHVAVYNADGSLVGNTAETTVEPGVYMVKADGKTVKVAVK